MVRDSPRFFNSCTRSVSNSHNRNGGREAILLSAAVVIRPITTIQEVGGKRERERENGTARRGEGPTPPN